MFSNLRMHFVGIGGVGMSGLAEAYHRLGAIVTGSDTQLSATTRRLQSLGIQVYEGHKADHVGENVDVVVYSSAIPENNAELLEARRRKIPLIARAEALAHLMYLRRSVAIAGTHGKTTTTSLMAEVMIQAGLEPIVVVGGRLIRFDSTAFVGGGEWLVAEADESDRSFLHLRPEIAIITNVDNDHLDFYGSFNNLLDAFYEFALKIPFYGFVMYCADDPWLQRLFEQFPKRAFSYGKHYRADFVLEILDKQVFQIKHKDKILGPFKVNLWGEHNLYNSGAVVSVGYLLGISNDVMARALAQFQGVERRMEPLINWDGDLEVFSDYAHHPTEIQATINAFRDRYPDRMLWVVFQPHRYSRTRLCWDQFLTAFKGVNKLYITDIYPAGEAPLPYISGERMAQEVKYPNEVYYFPIDKIKHVMNDFKSQSQPGVLIFMGAGDIHRKAKAFINEICGR